MRLDNRTYNRPGVGILFNPTLNEFVLSHTASLDYLSVIPDRSWIDNGPAVQSRFEDLPQFHQTLQEVACALPIVMHCIGLSICSAEIFDKQYLTHLAQWRATYDCDWASEHLSFSRSGTGHESNAAMALPSPYDYELLHLIAPRVKVAQTCFDCPFLLENNVYYFVFPHQELTEAAFLNELTGLTGCGLLLDLHNVYTNAINHRFDPHVFLNSLDLTKIVEIHVAGGVPMMGFHTDSHSGPVADPVWDLLSFVAPRAPSLRGVTFEFHESSWPLLQTEGVLAQLSRARTILARPHKN